MVQKVNDFATTVSEKPPQAKNVLLSLIRELNPLRARGVSHLSDSIKINTWCWGFLGHCCREVVHTLHPVQEKVILQSLHDLTRIRMWPENTNSFLNSFTAPACNISGMKSAYTDACKQTIFRSYNISTFTTVHFGAKPFPYWFKEEEETGFQISDFVGCFWVMAR